MTGQLFNDSSSKMAPRCHTTHKPIKLGAGEIVGGSCGSPRKGYDIYIGFCYTMKMLNNYPWESNGEPIIEFQYNITDMCAPKSPKEFKKLITWVAEQLFAGKRIHVGCIGGHGRTGTFLSALVAFMEKSDDPIKWVRKHHCKKAVESESQIKFLVKHFKCKTAKPTKSHHSSGTQTHRMYGSGSSHIEDVPRSSGYRKSKVVPITSRISHVAKKGSIWG